MKLVKYGFLLLALSVLPPAGHGITTQEGPYSYRIPIQLNDGWKVASLEDVGIDRAAIEGITSEVRSEERFDGIHSMLIVKNGKLVHEAYFWGHQRNTVHVLASITKTITSTLIGIAIDRGFIKSVDDGVLDYLSRHADPVKHGDKKPVKLKHIMSMSSGLDWNERVSYNALENSEYRMVDSENWIRFVLDKPLSHPPGSRYNYNTGGIHLLSAVIEGATGLKPDRFAQKYLFEPLGIFAYQWITDSTGYPCTGGTDGGVGLRTRDLAKIAWLFLRDGCWKGRRIVSEKWIKEATRAQMAIPGGSRSYGYNWWPRKLRIGGREIAAVATFGYGGQTLYLIPEADLILAFTCDLTDRDTHVSIPVRKTFDAIFARE